MVRMGRSKRNGCDARPQAADHGHARRLKAHLLERPCRKRICDSCGDWFALSPIWQSPAAALRRLVPARRISSRRMAQAPSRASQRLFRHGSPQASNDGSRSRRTIIRSRCSWSARRRCSRRRRHCPWQAPCRRTLRRRSANRTSAPARGVSQAAVHCRRVSLRLRIIRCHQLQRRRPSRRRARTCRTSQSPHRAGASSPIRARRSAARP